MTLYSIRGLAVLNHSLCIAIDNKVYIIVSMTLLHLIAFYVMVTLCYVHDCVCLASKYTDRQLSCTCLTIRPPLVDFHQCIRSGYSTCRWVSITIMPLFHSVTTLICYACIATHFYKYHTVDTILAHWYVGNAWIS